MAVGHRLPNGYTVVLLTPREAVLLRDQLLEPEQYPWMSTESQMVGMEVRSILTESVSHDAINRLHEVTKELEKAAVIEEMQAKGWWQCPNCSYVNGAKGDENPNYCASCSTERPEGAEE